MSIQTRKSDTVPEMYFQIREPHTSKKGKKFKAATAFARQLIGGKAWGVSLVRCSEEDNFNRAQGRTLAKRKYFKMKGVLVLPNGQVPTYEQVIDLYRSI